MGMFDISDEDVAKYTAEWRQMAEEKVGEPVIAMGPFRRGGAATNMAISKSGIGGLFYAANALRNKKQAGGLPARVFLVVTASRLHAFKWEIKGRGYKLRDEAAVWDRAGLRVSTEKKMGLTMLTIESPGENEKATLAPGGVKDDPWTQEVTRVLEQGVTDVPTPA
jgi:hypothetical protein